MDYVKDESLSKVTEHFPGDVIIELKNGKSYRCRQDYELGSQENPIHEDEIGDKFKENLAEAGIDDEKRIKDMLSVIGNLEEAASIEGLTALLR